MKEQKLHELHYSSYDIHNKIQELRKSLGDMSNPFIRIHNDTNKIFITGKLLNNKDIQSMEAGYKAGIARLSQELQSFFEALEKYESNPNAYKTGLQLSINYNGKAITGIHESTQKYLESSEKEIQPHISGRAARKIKAI